MARRHRKSGINLFSIIMIFGLIAFAFVIMMLAVPIFSSYDNNESLVETAAYNGTSSLALSFTELSPVFIIILCLFALLLAIIFLKQKYSHR